MKTSELTGVALDYMVAKCEGFEPFTDGITWIINLAGVYRPLPKYSSDWAQGGPLIEREHIAVFSVETCPFEGEWAAERHKHNQGDCLDDMGGQVVYWFSGGSMRGPTPLVAAMRCRVASKLGDEVGMPDELT